jgi:hypothetical protein
MKRAYLYLPFLLLLLGAACNQLGLPTAQTFEERLTAGYASVEAINKGAKSLLDAKKISSNDAENILDQTRNARVGLDIVRAMAKTDPSSADAKLNAVRAGLTAAQAYLTAKGK